jgi:chemotaxis protein CheD
MSAGPASPPRHAPAPGVHRYYDPQFAAVAVKVPPGHHYVTDDPREMLVTVLGSCVAACVRDRRRNIGGMNHFMLPTSRDGFWGKADAAMRFGNFAMEILVDDILKRGGAREDLEVKVFGGATLGFAQPIGKANAEFVQAYLREEQLHLSAHCLTPPYPLRVHFFPVTGRALVLPLEGAVGAVQRAEATYRHTITAHPVAGEIELFDGALDESPHPRPDRR